MFIEKTGMEFYRDSVQSAQVGTPVFNPVVNEKENFSKILEKNSSSESSDVMNINSGNSNSQRIDMNNSSQTDRSKKDDTLSRKELNTTDSTSNTESKESDKTKLTGTEEKKLTEEEKRKLDSRNQTETNDKESKLDKLKETNPDKLETKTTETSDIKGMLSAASKISDMVKLNKLNQEEMKQVKLDIQADYGESKSVASNDNLEKAMLKSLEDQGKTAAQKTDNTKEKTSDQESNDSKEKGETKKTTESSVEKKDESTVLKNEQNVQKKETNTENAQAQNVNLQAKETPLVEKTVVQAKAESVRQDLNEFYQVLKDKVSTSVEGSIRFMVSNGENRMNIQLHPPDLGRLQVDLMVKDNGMSARINAETNTVREVLLSNMDQLKSNLENAGINISQITVELGGFKNNTDQEIKQGKSGNGGNKNGSGSSSQGETKEEISPDKVKNQRPVSYFLGRSINVVI